MISKLLLQKKYYISLQVIVPIIFSGLSVLSLVISSWLTELSLETGSFAYFYLFGSIIAFMTYVLGLIIVRLILNPLKHFMDQVEEHPLVRGGGAHTIEYDPKDELAKFNAMYSRLTNILSKVEAKELFPDIIGQSRAIRGVLGEIVRIAQSESTILITGESGTGKDLIARNIHDYSGRRNGPFMAINCASIPENLLESELFGHEKGAFTGATARKIGKFETANKGTIFLDEIGDMPFALQGKLLRVLQEKGFERVGGTKTISIDVRFIAATNQPLQEMVKEGRFREDLFYRLNVIALHLPPLRDRQEDIPLLAEHILVKKQISKTLSDTALELLTRFEWPGNIRELESILESAALASDGNIIDKEHLPWSVVSHVPSRRKEDNQQFPLQRKLDDHLADTEKELIISALQAAGGVQVKAAELLGIKDRSLWHRIKKYELSEVANRTSKI